jgi:[ribosomal protein S5]-alanine N-acetyltransferase
MSWPRHRSIEDTRAFLAFSDAQWERDPAGAYLIESRATADLLGSTGLSFESPTVAETGYILARDAWGFGYATEALGAMVALARDLGLRRLHACCHPSHKASTRVLEKCGFVLEGLLERRAEFPNLGPDPADCLRYIRGFQ